MILAKSSKYKGRCIAGIDLDSYEWVRPINNPDLMKNPYRVMEDKSIFFPIDFNTYCNDQSGPELRDVVKICFKKKSPLKHQPENEMIDREKWIKKRKLPLSSLDTIAKKNSHDWIFNFKHKSETDRIPVEMIKPNSKSLTLLHLNKSEHDIHIMKPNRRSHKRFTFKYEGYNFNLALTDLAYYSQKKSFTDEQLIEDCYVTIGLGGLYEKTKAYHKLVVGFIPNLEDD